ncbi:traB domain-containing protein [Aplysia californica]|uniref:TraB domain-containing protein n=1 Tax=Aplysia californica TaxID=6500 RepID=A0ABM0K5T7_APLCA|nr:traB domain-containing protein [Aplysia californica]XP_005109413.1 traB domain-containing protein [Aplysia californica]
MSQASRTEDDDVSSNNNSGHIVVDNSENNNVDGAALYNKEDDEENPDQEDVWLTEDEDEDENYTDEEPEADSASLVRMPVPESELPDTVTVLERGGCRLYLVGTAHFSKESQEDVARVIQMAKPHVILVELCQSRVNILKMDEARILEEAKNINMSTIRQLIQRNGVMQGVLNILLLNMSAYITKELGMAPGGEFRTAFNEARKLRGGCRFILGDRPIQITLRRALASLSLWQRLKLAYAILCSKEPITKEDVEKCKQKDMLEQTIEQMTGEFPALGQVFVSERDVYLAHSLRKATQPVPCPEAPGGEVPAVVVGVVGIGHVKGITENWHKELDVEEICRLPPASMASSVARWGFRLTAIGLLTYGCYRASRLTLLPWISTIIK